MDKICLDVCGLVSYSLFGGARPEISDWKSVTKELKAQFIVPMLGAPGALDGLNMPAEEKKEVQKILFDSFAYYCKMTEGQNSLASLLASRGLKTAVIKGTSSGKYYKDPTFRAYGDIDFLVRGDADEDEISRILLENGFTLNKEKDFETNTRTINFKKDLIEYEYHRQFTPEGDDGDNIDTLLKSSELIETGTPGMYYYSDFINGMIMLSHIEHHILGKGLGLRQIVDFLCYGETVLTEEFWEKEFRPLAGKYGLEKLAIHVMKAGELLFGLPPKSFTAGADEAASREIIENVFASGNFGNKKDSLTKRAAFYSGNKNIFSSLQKGGMVNWKAAKKHKVLVPFAWLYQIGHIAKIYFKEESGKGSIGGALKKNKSRDSLAEKLGIGSESGERDN